VNPFSGTKKGRIVFKNVVAPMFEQAGIVYDHLMTGYANHAMERMKEQEKDSSITDVSKYDGIVAIGGDGIIHEILQGIRERSDCDEILSKLKLGVIGSGTSNGLSKSLVHASKEQATPIDNAFLIAKGITTSLDLSRYETKSASYLSFLTFSWAIIADIDIESEAIRFVGYLRMDLWGAWRTLFLRKYRARFSYLPPTNGKVVTRCPPLEESIPNDGIWVTCEDDFIMFWASQVTHAAESTFQTPQCKPDDGVFEILIIR
jgi:sphingosine kinase